jgi:hypothetical protein
MTVSRSIADSDQTNLVFLKKTRQAVINLPYRLMVV